MCFIGYVCDSAQNVCVRFYFQFGVDFKSECYLFNKNKQGYVNHTDDLFTIKS